MGGGAIGGVLVPLKIIVGSFPFGTTLTMVETALAGFAPAAPPPAEYV